MQDQNSRIDALELIGAVELEHKDTDSRQSALRYAGDETKQQYVKQSIVHVDKITVFHSKSDQFPLYP